MNIYAVITLGGLLGILLHALKTIRNINKRQNYGSFNDTMKEYWKYDKLSLLITFVCFMVLMFISSDFVDLNHLEQIDPKETLKERLFHFRLAAFIKTASVIAGVFADSIVYGFMGVAEFRIKAFQKDQEPKV